MLVGAVVKIYVGGAVYGAAKATTTTMEVPIARLQDPTWTFNLRGVHST